MLDKRLFDSIEHIKTHDLYPDKVSVEYSNRDLFLYDEQITAKRLREYMLAQKEDFTYRYKFCGLFRFDGTVEADIFHRTGGKRFGEICKAFYAKQTDNLFTFEWQHSTANYEKLLDYGMEGYIEEIRAARKKHTDAEKIRFLDAMEFTCESIIMWSEKCADDCEAAADEADTEARKAELYEMAAMLRRVPRHPAKSFREAVQMIYMCFEFLPDSIGLIDRTLLRFYRNDIANGIITRDEAKNYIGELFVRICSHTLLFTKWAGDKGAESHFAIGGTLSDGSDGFNELSRLIVETMTELPIPRPQVSLRITKKTSYEDFKYVFDAMRNDKFMRFAFVGDEPRLKGLCEVAKIPYEDAIKYTMVGCNEPALTGSIWFGGMTANFARSLETTLHKCSEEVCSCKTFDEVYKIFEREMITDVLTVIEVMDGFNIARSKDRNILSSIFIDGCIESAVPVNSGGARLGIAGAEMMGITCIIDSLSIIEQIAFIEKRVTMNELIDALKKNWVGYEELRSYILKKGRFFGNNDELSDGMARRLCNSLYEATKDVTGNTGAHFVFGTLAGYNPHHVWFGNCTKATPDGRLDGEAFMVGVGQTAGKDRNGLTALLNSVRTMDENGIFTGPVVCNAYVDEALIKNDDNFEKTARLVYTYFMNGGIHIQLNYVSKEELLKAKENPGDFANLRVRVSGFSGNFVNLHEGIQDDIIRRTVISH